MASLARIVADVARAATAAPDGEPESGDAPTPEYVPGAVPPFQHCHVSTNDCGFLDVVKSSGETIEYGVIVLTFADGRSAAEQAAIFELLDEKPVAPMVHQAMGIALSHLIDTYDKSRDPRYYMLCDDEELDVLDSGEMDGTMRTRAACSGWRVVAAYTEEALAVEFVGYPHDLTEPPRGWGLLNNGSDSWECLYDLSNLGLAQAPVSDHASLVKKIVAIATGEN